MKRVSIIGFGRFGSVLHRLLKDDFEITLYNRNPIHRSRDFTKRTKVTSDLAEVYKSDTVFYAVPIEEFEKVIARHRKYFESRHLLIDVLSVKIHPAKVFTKYLNGTKTEAMLTHPMFGPDSSKEGFRGLPVIIDKFTASRSNYLFWKAFLKKKGLRIVEMSAKDHDKSVANSQGLSHFIGRLLDAYGLKSAPFDTVGVKKLLEVKEQTRNDTWQLFTNLQQYNPYTKNMRMKLGNKYNRLYNRLLQKRVDPGYTTYGIQGEVGSFNEEAIRHFIQRDNIVNYKIKYLHTSANVMNALHRGEIDRGQFAIHNSAGGIVSESVRAMSICKFKIVEQLAIKIRHALMIREDADFSDITTIMTHPQVLAQCKNALAKKYPHLKQTSGKGKLVDHALVAKTLGQKKLPKNVAVMGSRVLAKLYNLKIVEDNLQDLKENYTTFFHVVRA